MVPSVPVVNPTGQALQTGEPEFDEYVAIGHNVHESAPIFEYEPAKQTVQLRARADSA